MNLSELKSEYKKLILEGKIIEAEQKIEEIRKMVLSENLDSSLKKEIVNEIKIQEEVKDELFYDLDNLTKIKGIGKKTIEDLKRICKSVKDLKKLLMEDKVPLRDDVVRKLKKHLEVN